MNNTAQTSIREKIALRIKHLGITKKSLCEDLDLTMQNFSSFLTGKRCFPMDDLERVMMYLGLTVKPKDYKPEDESEKLAPLDSEEIATGHYPLIRQKMRMRIGELNLQLGRIAARTGVNPNSLSSFLSGKRGLNIKHIEALMDVLSLTLVEKPGFTFGGTVKNADIDNTGAEAAAN